MRRFWIAAGILLAVALATGVQATDIFLWQHDNNNRVTDQVFRQSYTAYESMARTLQELDLNFAHNRAIPNNLNDYDLFIVCLGWYCPG